MVITVDWMMDDSSNFPDIQYLSLDRGRSFADKAGGKGDLSDSLNAAAPSCWESDQDALMISSVSEMYPTAVICLF